MHWASRPVGKPMIEPESSQTGMTQESTSKSLTTASTGGNAPDYVVGDVVWERQKGNDLLQKFRNYEI